MLVDSFEMGRGVWGAVSIGFMVGIGCGATCFFSFVKWVSVEKMVMKPWTDDE